MTTTTERRCSECLDEVTIDPRSGIAGGLCAGATVVEAPPWTSGPSLGVASSMLEVTPIRLYHPADLSTEPVESPDRAYEVLAPYHEGLDREACSVAYLDTKHRVLGTELVSLGALSHTFMSPRELLRGALLANAGAFVVAHNHPSGDPEPSQDDQAVTRRLVRAAEIIGVDLLDHIVIGGRRWVSLARRGCI